MGDDLDTDALLRRMDAALTESRRLQEQSNALITQTAEIVRRQHRCLETTARAAVR